MDPGPARETPQRRHGLGPSGRTRRPPRRPHASRDRSRAPRRRPLPRRTRRVQNRRGGRSATLADTARGVLRAGASLALRRSDVRTGRVRDERPPALADRVAEGRVRRDSRDRSTAAAARPRLARVHTTSKRRDPSARPAHATRYTGVDTVTACGVSSRRAGSSSGSCAGDRCSRRFDRWASRKEPGPFRKG